MIRWSNLRTGTTDSHQALFHRVTLVYVVLVIAYGQWLLIRFYKVNHPYPIGVTLHFLSCQMRHCTFTHPNPYCSSRTILTSCVHLFDLCLQCGNTVCFLVPSQCKGMCRQEYVELHQRYLVRGEQMLNEWQLRKVPRRTGTVTVKPNRKVIGSDVPCKGPLCRAMSGRAAGHASSPSHAFYLKGLLCYVPPNYWQPLLLQHSCNVKELGRLISTALGTVFVCLCHPVGHVVTGMCLCLACSFLEAQMMMVQTRQSRRARWTDPVTRWKLPMGPPSLGIISLAVPTLP